MSKIKYSALVSDVRNKLNGSVLSKNRYGNYIRNKTTPVNPQTTYQQNARSALAANSQAWGGLTEAQRNGWKALAQEMPFTDIFGDSKILGANALFVKLNGNLRKINGTTISAAPTKVAVPGVINLSIAPTSALGVLSNIVLTFGPSTLPVGFSAAIYATPGVTPGKSFVKNQFRLISYWPAGEVNPLTIFGEYSLRFGTPAVGMKIFVRVVLVSEDSGQQGTAQENVAIIV